MLNAADNERLTRTGAGTAMGEIFPPLLAAGGAVARIAGARRHAAAGQGAGRGPAGLSRHQGPRRPDRTGAARGHRGADLYFGRNEDCGIRCIYPTAGNTTSTAKCVELPNAPPGSAYHGKMSIKAYPTRASFGDIVWAFLGPRDRMRRPGLPQLRVRHAGAGAALCHQAAAAVQLGAVDGGRASIPRTFPSCSQCPAPAMAQNDTMTTRRPTRAASAGCAATPLPRFTLTEHDVGFVVGGARHRRCRFALLAHHAVHAAGAFDHAVVDAGRDLLRLYLGADRRRVVAGSTPMPGTRSAICRRKRARATPPAAMGSSPSSDPRYVALRNRTNEYLIDRNEQKHRSFTGVRGIAEQDSLAQDSQGPHRRPHTRAPDADRRGDCAFFAAWMLAGAKALGEGIEPAAAQRAAAYPPARRRRPSWLTTRSISKR